MSKKKVKKLKPEQARALDISTMKNIIVSAQAGAGKTFVLTRRIIELIEKERQLDNGIDIDNFLIVTFTNKAAFEMKDRIRKALYEKPKKIKFDLEEKNIEISDNEYSKIQKFYLGQYNKTVNAQISTMHSFGINILRKYFYKLGLNPNFKLLTDSRLEIMQWETMSEVFQDLYSNEDYEFQRLVSLYSNKYDDSSLMNMLFNIYNFIQSQLSPFEWLKENIDKIPNKKYFDIESNKDDFIKKFVDNAKLEIDKNIEIARKIIKSLKQEPDSVLKEKYINAILLDEEIIDELSKVVTYEEVKNINDLNFKRLPIIRAKFLEENDIDISEKEYFSSKINSYRKIIKNMNLLEFSQEQEIEFTIQMRESLDTIYRVLVLYDKKLEQVKKNQNSLDFNDIEHYLLKLLQDKEVVKDIQEKYKYIFFDEYQDANNIQNEIINKISRGDNLFFVGDIKQSIYKFRLADPKIFKQRYNDYKSFTGPYEAIDLHHNFRSHEQLLRFINMIFDEVMTDDLGDVDYKNEDHGLRAGLDEDDYDENIANIEIDYIIQESGSKDYKENIDIDDEILENRAEAVFIAKRISELIKNGKRAGDIAVIARSRSILNEVKENLIEFDIPYFYESSKFSYEDIEVKSFIEILKAIDNDNDDITLLSALTSSIEKFSDEELAKIRGNNKEDSFNYCFYNYESNENKDEKILSKINSYKSKMKKYRDLSRIMSLKDFAWYVFVDSGFMTYVLSKNDGDKKVEEINLLISEIGELEQQRFFTLTSLMKYIDRLTKRNLSEREPIAKLSEKDNVVRLMTIHKSKGLEFDTLFVCGLATRFNTSDLVSKVILNDEKGIALKTLNTDDYELTTSRLYNDIKDIKAQELLSEEVRILYVALTRAVNSLFLVSSVKQINSEYKSFDKLNNYNSWINKVFYDKIFTDGEVDENKLKYFRKKEKINLDVNLIRDLEIYEYLDNKKNTKDSEEYKEIEYDVNLSDIFIFNYDRSLVSVPYKKTVTELSAKDDNTSSDLKEPEVLTIENIESEIEDKKPKFIQETNSDSLEKGSLYHYLFELLPIREMNTKEIEGFLLDLVNRRFISQKEYESIDIRYFDNFINSELFKRLLNADKVYKERSFTMKYKEGNHDVLVDGQIDLYFIENGKISILDFKSNKKINEKAYEKQLNLYREGLEKAFNMEVKDMIIYWIMHDKVSYIKSKK